MAPCSASVPHVLERKTRLLMPVTTTANDVDQNDVSRPKQKLKALKTENLGRR